MGTVSTHVLDTSRGGPAAGVAVTLHGLDGAGVAVLGEGTTDADGRVRDLASADLRSGTYRLVFDTATYFASTGTTGFYPEVAVAFVLADPTEHYHVPLLLSPFGYSTYRGS